MIPTRILYNTIIAATEVTCTQLRSDEANYLRKEISNILHMAKLPTQNVDKHFKRAITELCKDNSIFILPTDKGNITVVMNRTHYRDKMMSLLKDPAYKELRGTPL